MRFISWNVNGLRAVVNKGFENFFKNVDVDFFCIQETKMQEEQIDLIVLAGYLAIVSEKLISKFENKIINIHPSLIPSFCGPGFYGIHVHEHAFNRGVKVSGATVHFVSNVVDGGQIILQRDIDISDCNSPEEIQLKI